MAGAFENCENLHYVRIPKSVRSIGPDAFKNTSLTKVCISRDCTFFESSFPDGCEIIYYDNIYTKKYDVSIVGVDSYRTLEVITHDEESTTCEIP
jgi:hypothetical protein